jgi:hypothetical protein
MHIHMKEKDSVINECQSSDSFMVVLYISIYLIILYIQ